MYCENKKKKDYPSLIDVDKNKKWIRVEFHSFSFIFSDLGFLFQFFFFFFFFVILGLIDKQWKKSLAQEVR